MDDFLEGMHGFTLPDDAGITPLPFEEDHGLCTECEGRPANFEVQKSAEATLRRLCHECLFREFAPGPTPMSEVIENERQRLVEAERTASPEELGRMIEFLERFWDGLTRPAPAFVTEFIARHHALAPPPATPVLDGAVTTADMNAARIALLVMRGGLAGKKKRQRLDDNQYVVVPNLNTLTREQAAEALARMPKPLECNATAIDGVMTVKCHAITNASYLAARRNMAEHWEKEGGYFSHLKREYGDRYPELKIFCAGWRESLVAATADVERYHHDYSVTPMGTNASPPSFYLATNPDVARAANAEGAAYVMKCHFDPNDWTGEREGRVIDLRDAGTWEAAAVFALVSDLDTTCERCGKRPATWLATDVRTKPWRDERLCDVCTATAVAPRTLLDVERLEKRVTSLSEKGRRSVRDELSGSLVRMERGWQRLPVPAEVAAALAHCRELLA